MTADELRKGYGDPYNYDPRENTNKFTDEYVEHLESLVLSQSEQIECMKGDFAEYKEEFQYNGADIDVLNLIIDRFKAEIELIKRTAMAFNPPHNARD